MAIQKKKEKELKQTGINISDTLDAIRTKFGDDAIMKLGDKPRVDVNAISTGSIGLDFALGVGGIPRGRIIEIFGPESSGKTTLSLHIVAEAQKKKVSVHILMLNMLWILSMQGNSV
jgi:RecA/RadA recombinase